MRYRHAIVALFFIVAFMPPAADACVMQIVDYQETIVCAM